MLCLTAKAKRPAIRKGDKITYYVATAAGRRSWELPSSAATVDRSFYIAQMANPVEKIGELMDTAWDFSQVISQRQSCLSDK